MRQRVFLNLNGKIEDVNKPLLTVANRSFRYGDGLFESFRAFGQKIPFFKQHFNRLLSGMSVLRMHVPDFFSETFVKKEILHLLRINKFYGSAAVRITIFRNDGGKYLPETNAISYLIETIPLKDTAYTLNKNGLQIGVFHDFPKPTIPHTAFKTVNAQIYIAAALYAQTAKWDDAILLNSKGKILEATSSNIFFVRNNYLFTPGLKMGIVKGIMRQKVIEIAIENNFIVHDNISLEEKDIGSFDEIFFTNSIKGIQWVSKYKNFRFFKKKAALLTEKLNQTL